MKPVGKRILIKNAKPKERTEAGLYIPTKAQERPLVGTVIAISDAVNFDQLGVEKLLVGARVLFSRYGGHDIGKDELYLMHQDEILAVLDPDEVLYDVNYDDGLQESTTSKGSASRTL